MLKFYCLHLKSHFLDMKVKEHLLVASAGAVHSELDMPQDMHCDVPRLVGCSIVAATVYGGFLEASGFVHANEDQIAEVIAAAIMDYGYPQLGGIGQAVETA